MEINKSKYCAFCQCEKSVWLKSFKPEQLVVDDCVAERLAASNEVCDLQRKLFYNLVDILSVAKDKTNTTELIDKTKQLIAAGQNAISRGHFVFEDIHCVVDILEKQQDGYALYKTKSSTNPNQRANIIEIAYQKYILQKCGINIVSTNVINVEIEYVFKGNLQTIKWFKITNIDDLVEQEIVWVEKNIAKLKQVLLTDKEPNIDLNNACHSPYTCGFWKYCSRHLPAPSVFDLYATSGKVKLDFYKKGVVSFEDLKNTGKDFGIIANMQLEHSINELPIHINKNGVKQFLDTLWYPLYFLDFETMQLGVPKYKKSKPYQPIPFQYSLHYIEHKGGEVKRKEFLATPDKDPRVQVAKSLYNDIPENACVLAYNKFFERDRIKELAKLFPLKRKKFEKIAGNIKDLIDPFSQGLVYNKNMGNSLSIKSVLPALYPDDENLNYHNLSGVQNGNEAMFLFPKLKNMSEGEQKIARKNLLEYCKLDTYAMVKIFEFLQKSIQQD